MEALQQPDAVLIGAGIMSVTLASILKRLDSSMEIVIYEVLSSEAQESSNAWNNAGTGHAALCELNYTPEDASGSSRATYQSSPRGLLAEDHTGTGHKWRLLNDDPWRRAYVIFETGADTQFIAG